VPPLGVLFASALGPQDGQLDARRALPSRELAPFVHHYWCVHWDLRLPFLADTLPHPAARIELWEQKGDLQAHIAGVRTGRFAKRHLGVGQFFGVQFRPAAFQPFLRASMTSVTDRVLPLTRGFGVDAAAWSRKVLAERRIETKVALTEAFLRSRLPTLKPEVERSRDLVERIAADRTLLTVEAAASAFGTDLRTLQRRFARFVGVSPKWVIQRYRLLEATAQLRTSTPPKLVELAATLGYADQAHFQREFKLVIGTTPGSFRVTSRH